MNLRDVVRPVGQDASPDEWVMPVVIYPATVIDDGSDTTPITVALAAGSGLIGAVVGAGGLVTPAITVSTSPAYSAGDSIGGKITLANAVRAAAGITLLQSIQILDRANQRPTGTILIFSADPAAATITDNAAFVFSTDDLKVVATVPVNTSDYVQINSKAVAQLRNIGAEVKAASGTTLYAAFVVSSTPTFAATTDLQLTFGFIHVD